MIAEYLASSWPLILPPALFIAGIAVGVKWHRAYWRRFIEEVTGNSSDLQRSAEAYAREARHHG